MAARKKVEETPLMKQYFSVKAKYPDAILLFRVGDFYETFGEDAIKMSKILGIVLTKRANGSSHIELAGFPFHAVDTYLPKLVKSGHRVAICEQLEDPKKTKKIVKRGVTELVSPGTSVSDKILDNKENNFLAAIHFDKGQYGAAFVDISTGDFLVSEGNRDYIENLLNNFNPSEILFSKQKQEEFNQTFTIRKYNFILEDWLFTYEYAYEKIINHFKVKNLKGFGIENLKSAITAAGVILHYLNENKQDQLRHINKVSRIEKDDYVWLDRFTIANLELLRSFSPDGASLVEVIDYTQTPMGSRQLKNWIVFPLKDLKTIHRRQSIVEWFTQNKDKLDKLSDLLRQIGDMERLISKAALMRINPREIIQIKSALKIAKEIREFCLETKEPILTDTGNKIDTCQSLVETIENTLVEDPPVNIAKGDLIKQGVSKELDELREIKTSGKDFLLKLREREIVNTGISSLKIGFNNVFGYYLEVTHAHKNKVPEEWTRKQTLVNAERYITEELKEYEEKILTAEEKITAIEGSLFQELLIKITDYIQPVQQNSKVIAFLDCLSSFAFLAIRNKYVKPLVDEGDVIDIKAGRHPVIEQKLPQGEDFIPNDVYLNNSNQQIIILTGPNMSGKSALLRQTALIILLAQVGSFVPAAEARIGFVDKIFTRVGASDNISLGESTFMVEMTETASILNNVSKRSLILLDEIGRGTSTYDGISIAWAVTEYLHQNTYKPKTIFATHYHELNEIASLLPRVRNFNVSVKEFRNKVIFLRKIVPGGSEHSFGIHVAQMAGVPAKIVERAKLILEELESQRTNIKNDEGMNVSGPVNIQLKMFDVTDPVYERVKKELNKIDVNAITPIEALMKINHLKSLLKKE